MLSCTDRRAPGRALSGCGEISSSSNIDRKRRKRRASTRIRTGDLLVTSQERHIAGSLDQARLAIRALCMVSLRSVAEIGIASVQVDQSLIRRRLRPLAKLALTAHAFQDPEARDDPLLEAGFCYTGIVLRALIYGEAPWVQKRVCEPKW